MGGLKFQFISFEWLSSFAMLSSAYFLLSSFLLPSFPGSGILLWVFDRRGLVYLGREKASVFSASKILHYALQPRDALGCSECPLHTGSSMARGKLPLILAEARPTASNHAFYLRKKVAQPL